MHAARPKWRTPLCFALALALAGPLPLHAGEPPSSARSKALARKHFMKAQKRFDAGDYQTAFDEMKEAYRLSPIPDLLFNLSRLAQKLGRTPEAISYLEQYLRERPDAPDAAEVRAQLEQLRGPAAPPAPVPAPLPSPAAPPAEPVRADPPRPAPPDLVPEPERPAPLSLRSAPGRPAKVPWPAIGVLAGGAALLIVGAGLGGGAVAAANTVERSANPASPQPFDAGLQATEQRGRSLQAAGIALDVLGAAALSAGAIWTGLFYARRRGQSPAVAAVRPLGLGLQLSGSY